MINMQMTEHEHSYTTRVPQQLDSAYQVIYVEDDVAVEGCGIAGHTQCVLTNGQTYVPYNWKPSYTQNLETVSYSNNDGDYDRVALNLPRTHYHDYQQAKPTIESDSLKWITFSGTSIIFPNSICPDEGDKFEAVSGPIMNMSYYTDYGIEVEYSYLRFNAQTGGRVVFEPLIEHAHQITITDVTEVPGYSAAWGYYRKLKACSAGHSNCWGKKHTYPEEGFYHPAGNQNAYTSYEES